MSGQRVIYNETTDSLNVLRYVYQFNVYPSRNGNKESTKTFSSKQHVEHPNDASNDMLLQSVLTICRVPEIVSQQK